MRTFFELAHMVDAYATAGVGWGGVGMMTFFELAHMVDATMMTFFELAHMVDATHTCWMLRNCWGGVGWGRDDDIL